MSAATTAAAAAAAGAAIAGGSGGPGLLPPPSYFPHLIADLQRVGRKISEECAQHGRFVTPIFGAYVARAALIPFTHAQSSSLSSYAASPWLSSASSSSSSSSHLHHSHAAAHQGAHKNRAAWAAHLPVVDPSTITFHFDRTMNEEEEYNAVQLALHRLALADDPELDTLKMQVNFELLYAAQLHQLRLDDLKLQTETAEKVKEAIEISTNISSNAQVASLYRALFQLVLLHEPVEPAKKQDKDVHREVAAALESVFPASGLAAFHNLSANDKQAHMVSLIPLVAGIRLFNWSLDKGGVGIEPCDELATREATELYSELDKESALMGDVCYMYSDILQLEHDYPGTIRASVTRLQDELTNRRQYVLFLHQLQHELLESLELIQECRTILQTEYDALKQLVGVRTSVPKEHVFPKFAILGQTWKSIRAERSKNRIRRSLLQQLLPFRSSFSNHILPADVQMLREHQAASAAGGGGGGGGGGDPSTPDDDNVSVASSIDGTRSQHGRGGNSAIKHQQHEFDEFVRTVRIEPTSGDGAGGAGGADAGDEAAAAAAAGTNTVADFATLDVMGGVVRLTTETTPDFMNLPLEYQGYCPWTIVHRAGALLPGNPSLGVLRWHGRNFSFVSVAAMRDFTYDPEKYMEGVIYASLAHPCLIHLLCLQPYVACTDISELLHANGFFDENANVDVASGKMRVPTVSFGCQTPTHIETDVPDPNYHWNEWELRRRALHAAKLSKARTHSTQTDLSHYRRENAAQTTVQRLQADGTMPGVATMTPITKATQVERVTRHLVGLRGRPEHAMAQLKTVTIRKEEYVVDVSNGDLRQSLFVSGARVGVPSSTSVASSIKL